MVKLNLENLSKYSKIIRYISDINDPADGGITIHPKEKRAYFNSNNFRGYVEIDIEGDLDVFMSYKTDSFLNIVDNYPTLEIKDVKKPHILSSGKDVFTVSSAKSKSFRYDSEVFDVQNSIYNLPIDATRKGALQKALSFVSIDIGAENRVTLTEEGLYLVDRSKVYIDQSICLQEGTEQLDITKNIHEVICMFSMPVLTFGTNENNIPMIEIDDDGIHLYGINYQEAIELPPKGFLPSLYPVDGKTTFLKADIVDGFQFLSKFFEKGMEKCIDIKKEGEYVSFIVAGNQNEIVKKIPCKESVVDDFSATFYFDLLRNYLGKINASEEVEFYIDDEKKGMMVQEGDIQIIIAKLGVV